VFQAVKVHKVYRETQANKDLLARREIKDHKAKRAIKELLAQLDHKVYKVSLD
jgi:hypothetical protein